jgi:hypothetical protein
MQMFSLASDAKADLQLHPPRQSAVSAVATLQK